MTTRKYKKAMDSIVHGRAAAMQIQAYNYRKTTVYAAAGNTDTAARADLLNEADR
ncbi:hypothetical protein JI735_13905 [Paenibacillus sonchi]|uniref:Uncharacterized protein n=1 Tax=Paenibacillus sonchi TaxID=373687 RepID=A0A974PHG0_9BACL|nr:hypothetical protein [Paenibacillus sonchi]QQZ63453.1 hypothetical protein JI735_13905 [Paenibacillus sonchi]